jgi:hypothetical protein
MKKCFRAFWRTPPLSQRTPFIDPCGVALEQVFCVISPKSKGFFTFIDILLALELGTGYIWRTFRVSGGILPSEGGIKEIK